MIQEIIIRKQIPELPDNWLYEEINGERGFVKSVYLGCNASPWLECTNEEKEEWEASHSNLEESDDQAL